jgi:hypothetical protein
MNKIITRAEAKAQGLTRYFTGEPCKFGHISQRNTASGGCHVCLNEKQKKRWKETYIPKPKKENEIQKLADAARKAGEKTFIAPERCHKGHEPIRIVAISSGNCKCLACYKEGLEVARRKRQEKKLETDIHIQKLYGLEVVSRKDARSQGKLTYFTGKPCKHGHVSKNFVRCGGCVECRKIHYLNNRASYYHRAKQRKHNIKLATPKWACSIKIETRYKERETMSRLTGLIHHVDHKIPLQGENVCGLHVPENLRVILARDNLSKSNKFMGA